MIYIVKKPFHPLDEKNSLFCFCLYILNMDKHPIVNDHSHLALIISINYHFEINIKLEQVELKAHKSN